MVHVLLDYWTKQFQRQLLSFFIYFLARHIHNHRFVRFSEFQVEADANHLVHL